MGDDTNLPVRFNGLSLLAWGLNPRRARSEVGRFVQVKKVRSLYAIPNDDKLELLLAEEGDYPHSNPPQYHDRVIRELLHCNQPEKRLLPAVQTGKGQP